ncbi:GNAT family N-acetyltransferase [Actinomycetes bacterium KLBMP 9759]
MTAHPWVVMPTDVRSAEASALLRDYFTEVADRYERLHHGRGVTPEEIDSVLARWPSDDLAEPTGAFLLGRRRGEPRACAGLRVREPGTVELTRVYVAPHLRGTGGGSALLAAVEQSARTLGAHRIVLDTRLDLVEARALYVRHGYRAIPAFSSGPFAQAWYGKDLAPHTGG